MLVPECFHRAAIEDMHSGQEVVGQGSERIDIASWITSVPVGDRLRGHEERSAECGALKTRRRPLSFFGAVFANQAEIQNFHAIRDTPSIEKKHVRRFDVAMDQSQSMRLGKRIADLLQNVDHSALALRTVPFDQLVEVQPAQELHGIVENSFRCVTVVVDLNGVGMSELTRQTNLPFESLLCLRVRSIGEKQLHRSLTTHE